MPSRTPSGAGEERKAQAAAELVGEVPPRSAWSCRRYQGQCSGQRVPRIATAESTRLSVLGAWSESRHDRHRVALVAPTVPPTVTCTNATRSFSAALTAPPGTGGEAVMALPACRPEAAAAGRPVRRPCPVGLGFAGLAVLRVRAWRRRLSSFRPRRRQRSAAAIAACHPPPAPFAGAVTFVVCVIVMGEGLSVNAPETSSRRVQLPIAAEVTAVPGDEVDRRFPLPPSTLARSARRGLSARHPSR